MTSLPIAGLEDERKGSRGGRSGLAITQRLALPNQPGSSFDLDKRTEGFELKHVDRDGVRGCRWPVNAADVGELHLFCGDPAEPARPYCATHCQRAGAGYRLGRVA